MEIHLATLRVRVDHIGGFTIWHRSGCLPRRQRISSMRKHIRIVNRRCRYINHSIRHRLVARPMSARACVGLDEGCGQSKKIKRWMRGREQH
jgi:hypothetical protein